MRAFQGGCHCGELRVVFTTALDPGAVVPRACDCAFCRKHGACHVSDPAGTLSITTWSDASLRRYRQGSNTAQFLLCGQCGVLVAVVMEHAGRIHGAVNALCLEGTTGFAPAVPASPQSLSAGDKVDRWLRLWVPDVDIRPPPAA